MQRFPVIDGIIRRRLLLNFRADPAVVQRILPAPMRPKMHAGFAIVGICLIRLERIKPASLRIPVGISSENAAHRIAVLVGDSEGVYIPRRDTGSHLNALAGGRLFPGEHRHARFEVTEGLRCIELRMRSRDGEADIEVDATQSRGLPATSCFQSLAESSAFFAGGCNGYSATCDPARLDGVRLDIDDWRVHPLEVSHVRSSYFENMTRFPGGSLHFDHGLIMRNIPHRWHSEPSLDVGAATAA